MQAPIVWSSTQPRQYPSFRIFVHVFVLAVALAVACTAAHAMEAVQPAASAQKAAPANKAAQAKTPETGLEAGRPEAKSAPRLEPLEPPGALAAPAPEPAIPAKTEAPSDIARFQIERMGKLENYIRNNESVRKAERLRSDPRVGLLPAQVRGDFLNEFGTLMFSTAVPSRDGLIARTKALDHDQMEMEDRTFKYRENVAAFSVAAAGLSAETEEHNKKVAAYEAERRTYESDVAAHNARAEDHRRRVSAHDAEAATHNAEVANYSAQCTGAPLPPDAFARCNAWQQALNARWAMLSNRKSQLDGERATLMYAQERLNNQRAALQTRNNQLTARYAELQSRREALAKTRSELVAEEQKLKDWQTLLQPQWDFELKQIEQWRALVDKFNDRFEKTLASVKTPPSKSAWTGSWNDNEQKVVTQALQGWKDGKLRSWLTENAQLNRFKKDTFSPITANGSELRFKDDFFVKTSTSQENLMAFEAGKVFWNSMKDRPVEQGASLESWFAGYATGHDSVIQEMRAARHGNENLTWVTDYDTASQFAYIFRAQVIELEKPTQQRAKQQWETVARDFSTRLDRLLQR